MDSYVPVVSKEEQEYTLSIIVPVFNTENELEKCIMSILNQTFKDYELILVDDGSTDSSPQICDEFAKKDSRIKVLHIENSGMSLARNAGLKIAKGRYFGFADSDDWLDEKMFEKLIDAITKYDADISMCECKYIYPNRVFDEADYTPIKTYNKRDALRILFENIKYLSYSWNKVFKRELFEQCDYLPHKYYEDVFLMTRLFQKAELYVAIDESYYNYLQREGSVTKTRSMTPWMDYLDALDERVEIANRLDIDEINKAVFMGYAIGVRKYLNSEKNVIAWERLDKFYMDNIFDNRKIHIINRFLCKILRKYPSSLILFVMEVINWSRI